MYIRVYCILIILFAIQAQADLVRLTHYPAAMEYVCGWTDYKSESSKFCNWKITNALSNTSPYASGFVVDVKEDIVTEDSDPELDWIGIPYPAKTKFKAVYILTNYHVWVNDRASLQNERLNPNSNKYSIMVATPLLIYGKDGNVKFQKTYFPESSPINTMASAQYKMTPHNMGLRQISYCYQPKRNSHRIGNLNFNWGCDFYLLRILVPADIDIQPEVIASNELSKGEQLDVWFAGKWHGNYAVEEIVGNKSQAFIADIDNYSYVIQSGWSGSPALRKKSNEVVGLTFSGWPGASTKGGFYSIHYVMDVLNVKKQIDSDYKMLLQSNAPIYKGEF